MSARAAWRNERGIALPMAMMVMAALSTLVLSLLSLARGEPQIARNHEASAQARAMAESGLERALWALTAGTTTPETAGALADPLPTPVPAPYDGAAFVQVSALGGFKVAVTDGPGAGERTIVATGYAPSSAAPAAVKKIQVVVEQLRFLRDGGVPLCALCVGGETPEGSNAKLVLNNSTISASTTASPAARFCGDVVPQGAFLTTGSVVSTGNTSASDPAGQPGSRDGVAASVFAPFTLTDADLAALKALAKANGTYFTGARTWTADDPPPSGIVFVDTTTGAPFTNATPDEEAASVTLSGTFTWSGWLIVAGVLTIPSGTPSLTGILYALNDLTINTEATVSGAVVSTNRKDALSSNVDSMEKKATITYDCPAMRDPGGLGLIPRGWSVKPGTYREIAG
jgi:hypothetical protein